jgi:hypothetical protein
MPPAGMMLANHPGELAGKRDGILSKRVQELE